MILNRLETAIELGIVKDMCEACGDLTCPKSQRWIINCLYHELDIDVD